MESLILAKAVMELSRFRRPQGNEKLLVTALMYSALHMGQRLTADEAYSLLPKLSSALSVNERVRFLKAG